MPDVIKNESEARHRANVSLSHHKGDVRNCIVTQHGSVFINCDVKATEKQLNKEKEKYFIVKDEQQKEEEPAKPKE